MNLTKTAVVALETRPAEYVAWDSRLPGFGVRVHPTGRKVFMVRYRTQAGTQRKMNLGRADVLTVDEAREMARKIMAEAADGGDPAKQRRDTRNGMTLRQLAEEFTAYKANHVKAGTAANHRTNWQRNILPILGARRVADITQSDVIDLHINRGRLHPVNANRCVSLLKAAFNYAERRGWREKHTNPAKGIELFPEFERQRILKASEIERLFKALDAYVPERGVWSAPFAIKLLAVSGLRKTEWTLSRWDWIDWQAGTLTLPDSKTGPKVVHLSGAVLAILKVMRGMTSSQWICPCSDPARPLMGLGRHWANVRAMAGLDDVRLHDLRHTVGSLGHMAGLSQKQIADLLGHRRLSTSARYIHSYDNAKRAAADVAANAVAGQFMHLVK